VDDVALEVGPLPAGAAAFEWVPDADMLRA